MDHFAFEIFISLSEYFKALIPIVTMIIPVVVMGAVLSYFNEFHPDIVNSWGMLLIIFEFVCLYISSYNSTGFGHSHNFLTWDCALSIAYSIHSRIPKSIQPGFQVAKSWP